MRPEIDEVIQNGVVEYQGVQLVRLKPGTKVYRVFDDIDAFNNGGYWTFELPSSKANFYRNTAVRPEWNGGTKYVELTVPSEGLPVWRGNAANQRILNEIDDWTLLGGGEQVFIPYDIRTNHPDFLTWLDNPVGNAKTWTD